MRVRIEQTVDVDDDYRREINRYYGKPGFASRQEVKKWIEAYGSSMDDDLAMQAVDNKDEDLNTPIIDVITLPRSVWDDALDPLMSGMQADLGLPEPTWRKVGKGWQIRYSNVPVNIARELQEYLSDRAETMLAQDLEAGDKDVFYTMRYAAEKIYKVIKNAN